MTGARDLSRLLRPKTIAVIGGGFFAPNVVTQCLKMGYAGEIWPVHPGRDAVAGVKAYRSVDELPAAPDAAFVGVNRFLSVEIVRALGQRGAGGAVCFAAGFLETGEDDADGARLQRALVEAAGSMPIIGPNCYGLINYADGALLWPDQHGGVRLPEGRRGVAIVTQSSNIAINMTMQKRGLPIAYLMTAGNQAQTGLSDMALGLIEDDRVSALGLHIEGFDSVAGFERLAARARELRKPVVAIKAGRSEQARQAAISHTASLAGSDAASDAFLKRLGIARVDTIPSFLEALKLLHAVGPLGGGRLSSMSCSGGEASVMADAAQGRRVRFPALGDAHKARIRAALGPLVAVANPLDYNTFIWNDEPAMTAAFSAMVSGGFDLDMLVLDFPRTDRCSDADWWPTVNAFETALKANAARGAIVVSMPENVSEENAVALMARGIVPLLGVGEALDAAEAAAFVGEAWEAGDVGGGSPPSVLPDISPTRGEISQSPGLKLPISPLVGEISQSPASKLPISPLVGETSQSPASKQPISPLVGEMSGRTEGGNVERQPDEAEAKALLSSAGLPVPPGLRASTAEEAVDAASALGFPVALKSLGIAHKSEAGAVRLGLRDADAVRKAARDLAALGTGIYVERMVQGGVAELIVGVTREPPFGPVMTIGTGGVMVELLNDTATLLLPATRAQADAALRGLRLFPLLDGYRGRPRADLGAALDAILAIAGFVEAHAGCIGELDINPLIVCGQGEGAWIADALLVRRE